MIGTCLSPHRLSGRAVLTVCYQVTYACTARIGRVKTGLDTNCLSSSLCLSLCLSVSLSLFFSVFLYLTLSHSHVRKMLLKVAK